MHDVKAIRENPTKFATALQRRGTWNIDLIVDIDQRLRGHLQERELLAADLKIKSREFGDFKRRGEPPSTTLIETIGHIKSRLEELERNPNQSPEKLQAQRDAHLAGYPNGRRPGDDTVDITLRVAMGRLCHPVPINGANTDLGLCTPACAPTGLVAFTDGAPISARELGNTFPYLNTPIPGSPLSTRNARRTAMTPQ